MTSKRPERPLSDEEIRSLGLTFTLEQDVRLRLLRDAPVGRASFFGLSDKERLILDVTEARMKQELAKIWEYLSNVQTKLGLSRYDQE